MKNLFDPGYIYEIEEISGRSQTGKVNIGNVDAFKNVDQVVADDHLASWIPSNDWLDGLAFIPREDKPDAVKHMHQIELWEGDEILTVGVESNTTGILVRGTPGYPSKGGIPQDNPLSGSEILLRMIREYDASKVMLDPFTVSEEISDGWVYNKRWLDSQYKPFDSDDCMYMMANDYISTLPRTEEGDDLAGMILDKMPCMIELTRSFGDTLTLVEKICVLGNEDAKTAETVVHNAENLLLEKGYNNIGMFLDELNEDRY